MASSVRATLSQFLGRTVKVPSWLYTVWLLCAAHAIISGLWNHPVSTVIAYGIGIGIGVVIVFRKLSGGQSLTYPIAVVPKVDSVPFWDRVRTVRMWFALAISVLVLIDLAELV
jgi:hypothetical protein